MSAEENAILLERIRDGDCEALARLAEKNMGLVHSIALRFTGRGTDYEDLVQIGSMGMIKAARSFDPAYGCVFSTYAVPLIAGEIKRFLRDDGSIKVGRELKRKAAAAARAREALESRLGREPRLGELARECGLEPAECAEALSAYSPVHSLDEPVGGGEGSELGALLCDPEDAYDIICEREALGEALRGLGETARSIIYLRYRKELSQAQTGRILGISQVKVSREEKKIIEQLRRAL